MKKFLTVLLALSVVFTYSFSAVGSVFAAATPAEQANAVVADEQKAMAEYVDEFAGKIVYNQQGNVVSVPDVADASLDKNLTKAAIDAALAKLKADYNEKIATKAAEKVADNQWTADDTAAVVAEWADLKGADGAYAVGAKLFAETEGAYGATDGILYTEAVKAAKAIAQAAMEAIDPANYSETDAATITTAKTTLTAAVTAAVNSKAGLQTLLTAITTFKTATKDLVTNADAAAALDKAKKAAIDAVNDAATDFTNAERARLQAIIAAPEDITVAADVAAASARLGSLNSNVQKVVALYVGQINEAETETAVTTAKTAALTTLAAPVITDTTKGDALVNAEPRAFYGVADKFANVNLLVKYATDYASALKTQYDAVTGKAVYNAATVDAALEKLVKKINNLDADVDTYGEIQSWMQSETNIPKAATEVTEFGKVIEDGIALIKSNDADVTLKSSNADLAKIKTTGLYAVSNWDGDNKTAVEAIQKDYEAKIKAAANADAVVALVKEARAAMDKYLTTAQTAAVKASVDAELIAAGYVGKTADNKIDATTGFLKSYADGVAARDSANTYSAKTKADAVAQALDVFYDAVNAKQNANLKSSEIKAILSENYAAALAKIDAMKADAVLAAEAQKVIDAIKALPATATLENKADYLAVQKMYEDYLELAGATEASVTNRGLLNAYVTRIINLERAAAEALVNALPRTITVADKAAVEAARAAVDAYADNYSKYAGYTPITTALTTLGNAETALSNAMKADAAKKIAALPEVITAADKEAVDAAKAAYDALSDADKAAFDRDSAALVAKLELAVKAIAAANNTAVESLKITASSTAAKGSITVKWTVKGDTSVADGFEVFRSVKKNSGFTNKAFFTTDKNTKRSYKNTKSLKKGTRYYYKVRAYKVQEDGTKLYSDWSNKAYRIAK